MTESEEPKVSPFENINSEKDLMMYFQTHKPQLLGAQQDEDDATPTTADEVARRIARKMTLENRRLARETKDLAGKFGFSRSKTNNKEMPTMVEMQAGGLTLQLSLVKGTGAYGESRGFGIAGEAISSVEQITQNMRIGHDLNVHPAKVIVPRNIANESNSVILPAIRIEAKSILFQAFLDCIDYFLPENPENPTSGNKALVLAFKNSLIYQESGEREITVPAEWDCVPKLLIEKKLSENTAIFNNRIYLRK